MTPAQFAAAMHARAQALAAVPSAVESVAAGEVSRAVGSGVGVMVQRSPGGVRLVFSGRGARRYAAAARKRVEASAVPLVAAQVRRTQ